MTNVLKMEELLGGEIQPKRVYVMDIMDKLFSSTIDSIHMEIVFPTFIDSANKRLKSIDKTPVLFSYGGEPVTISHIKKDIESSLKDNQLPLGLFIFDIDCLGKDYGDSISNLKDIAVQYEMPVIVYRTSMKPLVVVLEDNTIEPISMTVDRTKIIENSDVVLLFNRKDDIIDCKTIKNRMDNNEVKFMEFTTSMKDIKWEN